MIPVDTTKKFLLTISLVLVSWLSFQSVAIADSNGSVNDSNLTNPGLIRKDYTYADLNNAPFVTNEIHPEGKDVVEDRKSKGPGMVQHNKSGPVYLWPVPIPTASSPVPTKRDEGIQEHLLKTFGYPLSDTQFQMIHRYNQNIMLAEMFDPERIMWTMNTTGAMQAQNAANSAANVARANAASAIDFTASFLYNFTVDGTNKWNKLRNELFIPMALLILLPGAVLAQVRAIIAAGTPVIGEVSSPFEGILRSIVAIFLIPATYLVINYGIDVANTITQTIAKEYKRMFHSDMYKDALCGEVRAFPIRQPNENQNAMTGEPQKWTPLENNSPDSPAAQFEGMTIASKIEDPCANKQVVPKERADDRATMVSITQRLVANGSNAGLAATWNLLCAFQMAYLYYLWCVGPVVAALWVWPMKQLRDALPSWIEGVITLCFWSLFWNTVIMLMGCFRGVDETGTLIMSALNFLAVQAVKSAFDFAGLVKAAGQHAAGQAMGASGGAARGAGSGAQSHGKGGHGGGHPSHASRGGNQGQHGAHAAALAHDISGTGSHAGAGGDGGAGGGSVSSSHSSSLQGASLSSHSLGAGGSHLSTASSSGGSLGGAAHAAGGLAAALLGSGGHGGAQGHGHGGSAHGGPGIGGSLNHGLLPPPGVTPHGGSVIGSGVGNLPPSSTHMGVHASILGGMHHSAHTLGHGHDHPPHLPSPFGTHTSSHTEGLGGLKGADGQGIGGIMSGAGGLGGVGGLGGIGGIMSGAGGLSGVGDLNNAFNNWTADNTNNYLNSASSFNNWVQSNDALSDETKQQFGDLYDELVSDLNDPSAQASLDSAIALPPSAQESIQDFQSMSQQLAMQDGYSSFQQMAQDWSNVLAGPNGAAALTDFAKFEAGFNSFNRDATNPNGMSAQTLDNYQTTLSNLQTDLSQVSNYAAQSIPTGGITGLQLQAAQGSANQIAQMAQDAVSAMSPPSASIDASGFTSNSYYAQTAYSGTADNSAVYVDQSGANTYMSGANSYSGNTYGGDTYGGDNYSRETIDSSAIFQSSSASYQTDQQIQYQQQSQQQQIDQQIQHQQQSQQQQIDQQIQYQQQAQQQQMEQAVQQQQQIQQQQVDQQIQYQQQSQQQQMEQAVQQQQQIQQAAQAAQQAQMQQQMAAEQQRSLHQQQPLFAGGLFAAPSGPAGSNEKAFRGDQAMQRQLSRNSKVLDPRNPTGKTINRPTPVPQKGKYLRTGEIGMGGKKGGGNALNRALNMKGNQPAKSVPEPKRVDNPFSEVHLASIKNRARTQNKQLNKQALEEFAEGMDWNV